MLHSWRKGSLVNCKVTVFRLLCASRGCSQNCMKNNWIFGWMQCDVVFKGPLADLACQNFVPFVGSPVRIHIIAMLMKTLKMSYIKQSLSPAAP